MIPSNEVEDASARFLPTHIKRRAQEVQDVQDYFQSDPFPPGLETFISFAISAPPEDKDLLAERAKRLQRAYRPVKLYRPFALQSDLFGEHMLRPDGAVTREYRRDYKRLLIVEQLAAMMPLGANAGGSSKGYYIGYTIPGAKRPVRYSPLEASETNRAGAVLLNGTLGSGKTISVEMLAYLSEHRGSLVVDIDPKKPIPDHSLERWPGMEGRTHEILITNETADEQIGLLDPLVYALKEMSGELAISMMENVLSRSTAEYQTEITEAVQAVMGEPEPCGWKVIDFLMASEEPNAQYAGRALRAVATSGLGKYLFSRTGRPEGIEIQRPVTMFKAPALTLPMAGMDKTNYDPSERKSVEALKQIIARAMRTLSSGGDRTVHKFLVIDEAHVLTTTNDGRRFLEMVIRMGRYMNITVVLASQLAGDLAELEQLIGVRFIFRQETDEQAAINLRALGLDDKNEKLIAMLRNFSDGRCLMRGLDGRVVAMKFDTVDPRILQVASTRPSDFVPLEAVAA